MIWAALDDLLDSVMNSVKLVLAHSKILEVLHIVLFSEDRYDSIEFPIGGARTC